ncbi:MAG TPA: FAD-dependent oxidoreductase [Candidatus Methanoperedenaceae archaeon]|nr:FAD-dependent oxidoreductase [Candidatus Methanoperedenaceae archaeon]
MKGELEFTGKGVSYCATCDGFFFKGKTVAVIGGGDAALSGAEMLADLAAKVYIVHRRQEFRGEPVKLDRLKSKPNIQFVLDCIVEEVRGDKTVNAIIIKNVAAGEKVELRVDGVFVEIGAVPSSEIAKELDAGLDSSGYIIVDDSQRTTIEGVYAAGDISTGSNRFRQIITAAAEGAIAADAIYRYLKSKSQ